MYRHNLIIAASLAFAVPVAGQAQQSQTNPSGRTDVLGNLLGGIFGNRATTDQTLESDLSQGRRPFAQRRETLETRIAAAVDNGSISRLEADTLNDEYDEIVELEARYAQGGTISVEERRDLRARYRALVARVGDDRGGTTADAGGGTGGVGTIAAGRSEFETQVDAALRQRRISVTEAPRLRAEYGALVDTEASYRRGGIDARECADLDTRLAALNARMSGGGGFGADNNPARWQRFETRIAAGERSGALPRRDAVQLRTELADLARLDAAYAAGGLNADERAYLSRRYAEVESRVAPARR